MIIITKWQDTVALEHQLADDVLNEVKEYFKTFVTEQLEESDYQKYNMTEIGRIAILEEKDDIEELTEVFLTRETGTLLESIPEYIEIIDLKERQVYRIIFILGDCFGVVLYVLESLVDDKLRRWLDKYNEGEGWY